MGSEAETSFVIRYAEDKDIGQIVSLLTKAFNGWPSRDIPCSQADHWKWKYGGQTPSKRIIYVVEVEDRIIGAIHSVPLRLKLFEEHLFACLGGDVAVDPDYRRRGVWRSCLEEINERRIKDGVGYLYNVTGNAAVIGHFDKSKEYQLFPLRLVNLVKIKDIDEQLREMPMPNPNVNRWGYRLLSRINKLSYHKTSHKDDDVKVTRINEFGEDYDKFWWEASQRHDYIVERPRQYLNWRYCDARSGNNIVYKAEKNGVLQGFIVLSTNKINPDYPVGFITDFLVHEYDWAVSKALIDEALHTFDNLGINIVNFLTVRGHPNMRALTGKGFVDSRVRIFLFYNSMGNESLREKIFKLKPSRTHLVWGDVDTLPVHIPSYSTK